MPEKFLNCGWGSHMIRILILMVIIGYIYRNSIDNDFAFDDHLAIVNNADTDPNQSYLPLWGNDIWGKGLREHDSHRSYRPLLIITFKILRYYYGLNPGAIRIASITSHAVNTIILYIMGLKIIGNANIVFMSCLLFASHPVHVESVTAVVNIAEPLSSIFICISYLCYLMSISSTTPLLSSSLKQLHKAPSFLQHFLYSIGFIISLIISCLYKETAITLIGITIGTSIFIIFGHLISKYPSPNFSYFLHIYWMGLCLGSFILYFLFRKLLVASPHELIILCPYLPRSVSSLFIDSCSRYSSKKSALGPLLLLGRDTIAMLISLFSTPIKGLVPGSSSQNSSIPPPSYSSFYLDQSQLIRRAENPFAFLNGTTEKYYSFSYLHFRYMYLLLYPEDLCAEYAFNCIPKVSAWEDDRAKYPLIMYGVLLLIALHGVYHIWKHARTKPGKSDSDESNIEDSVSPLGSLISLMFMVIPFIPASGIFLRLGTLLAERLLYVPSIGYCYLLAIFLGKISSTIFNLLRVPFQSLNSRKFLFGSVLSLLLSTPFLHFYSTRTITRNLDWKDDRTLFFSGYQICPQSAKLNLQIAKIYLNEQNYTAAEFHIQKAQTIDPTFCDISHQQALLAIVYYQDVEKAIHHLLESLKCVFTLSSSWKILSQIWEDRMRNSPKDFSLVSEIGDQCSEAGLTMMALRQYQQATSMAFDQKKYISALKANIKAEKVLKKLFKELMNYPADKKYPGLPDVMLVERKLVDHQSSSAAAAEQVISWEVYRELECNLYSLGGLLRHQMYEEYQKKSSSSGYSANVLEELSRGESFLMMALRPVCVYDTSDPKDERVLIPHQVSYPAYPPVILQTLTQSLSSKYQASLRDSSPTASSKRNDILYSLARFTDQAAALYAQYYHLKVRELPNPEQTFSIEVIDEDPVTGELYNSYKQMKESLQTSLQFYKDAGEGYFHDNRYNSSIKCFERIREINSTILLADIWGEDIKTIQVPCSVSYWYAHALVTQEGYLDKEGNIEKILQLLQDTLQCIAASPKIIEKNREGKVITKEMKRYAKEQIEELQSYVEERKMKRNSDKIEIIEEGSQ